MTRVAGAEFLVERVGKCVRFNLKVADSEIDVGVSMSVEAAARLGDALSNAVAGGNYIEMVVRDRDTE